MISDGDDDGDDDGDGDDGDGDDLFHIKIYWCVSACSLPRMLHP